MPETIGLKVDRIRCEGHGLCEDAAPELMHLDDDGELVLDVTEVDSDDSRSAAAAMAAVRICPVAALSAD